MKTGTVLTAYGTVLAAAFAGSWAIGAAVGPLGAGPLPGASTGHSERAMPREAPAATSATPPSVVPLPQDLGAPRADQSAQPARQEVPAAQVSPSAQSDALQLPPDAPSVPETGAPTMSNRAHPPYGEAKGRDRVPAREEAEPHGGSRK